MFEYRATAEKVIDGDTVDLDIDLGCHVHIHERVRLAGINTPEKTSKDEKERVAAKAATDHMLALIGGKQLLVKTEKDKQEKYGRYLATIFVEGQAVSVNDLMVQAGLAKPYDGGKRE